MKDSIGNKSAEEKWNAEEIIKMLDGEDERNLKALYENNKEMSIEGDIQIEEALEILEHRVNKQKLYYAITNYDLKAIKRLLIDRENLLARNKELEEEYRQLREEYQTENQYYKSKIEDKIKEINQNIEYITSIKDDRNKHIYYATQILQELIEEE